MFESINSYSQGGLSSMMQQMEQMQSYIDGEYTISKKSLDALQAQYEEEGTTTPEDLKKMIDNYDLIDKNGDGIGYAELASFAKKNDIELEGLNELNKSRNMNKYKSMIGNILLGESQSSTSDLLGSYYNTDSFSNSYTSALLNAYNGSSESSSGGLSALI